MDDSARGGEGDEREQGDRTGGGGRGRDWDSIGLGFGLGGPRGWALEGQMAAGQDGPAWEAGWALSPSSFFSPKTENMKGEKGKKGSVRDRICAGG